jgi:hypothetical protein
MVKFIDKKTLKIISFNENIETIKEMIESFGT